MDRSLFVYGICLLVLAVLSAYRLDVAGINPSEESRWWKDSVAPWEGFQPSAQKEKEGGKGQERQGQGQGQGQGKGQEEEGDHMPGMLASVDLSSTAPYHLLADRLGPVEEVLSCVTSRSCFATDAEQQLSRVGNYRQLTNNYKREYPDSCSAPRQELVLGFYQAKAL